MSSGRLDFTNILFCLRVNKLYDSILLAHSAYSVPGTFIKYDKAGGSEDLGLDNKRFSGLPKDYAKIFTPPPPPQSTLYSCHNLRAPI